MAATRALDAAERNRLLRGLTADAYDALLPHLEPVELLVRQVLWEPRGPIEAVYFPRTAVCLLRSPLADEASVESATVGYGGMKGVPVVLGAADTHTKAIDGLVRACIEEFYAAQPAHGPGGHGAATQA